MIGALLLGLAAGVIGRAIVPDQLLEHKHQPASWLASVLLGLLGSFWGWLFFTAVLGVGDTAPFDWGGALSALIGVLIILVIVGCAVMQESSEHRPAST